MSRRKPKSWWNHMSKTVKSIIVSVAMLTAFLTTAFAFDSRYLHVAEFKQWVNTNQKEYYEEKIFAIELKNERDRTKEEKAFLERYKRKLEELNQKMEK